MAKKSKHSSIAAGKFKTHCLKLIDDVHDKRSSLTITKHGKPMAKLVPIEDEPINLFGILENAIEVNGDIVEPLDIEWESDEPNV